MYAVGRNVWFSMTSDSYSKMGEKQKSLRKMCCFSLHTRIPLSSDGSDRIWWSNLHPPPFLSVVKELKSLLFSEYGPQTCPFRAFLFLITEMTFAWNVNLSWSSETQIWDFGLWKSLSYKSDVSQEMLGWNPEDWWFPPSFEPWLNSATPEVSTTQDFHAI